MKKDFVTVTGLPVNGGTVAFLKAAAAQLPTEVPAKGGPTVAWVARPLGAKVTVAVPLPVGPLAVLQPAAEPAAPPRAERAASTLNSPAPFFSSSGFFSSSFVFFSS